MTPVDELLLRSLTPGVLGVLVRRGADFAAAEDAVQDALVEAVRVWPTDPPRDPRGWLVTVAWRRFLDAARAVGRTVVPAHDGTEINLEGEWRRAPILDLVSGALGEEVTGASGTPAFAPPEQLLGEPQGAAVDVFAMGAILYYALEGHPPFAGADGPAVLAAQLMHFAYEQGTPPKHVDGRLLTVKDEDLRPYAESELRELHAQVTDPNFRIFADRDWIYVFNADLFVKGTDFNEIFDQLGVDEATHAFYLGKELMKATIARALGKNYRQEAPLDWGYMSFEEPRRKRVRLTTRPRK